MSRQKIIIVVAMAEAFIILTGLILSLYVFPDANGKLNIVLFLPIVLLASLAASSVILTTVMKNKPRG